MHSMNVKETSKTCRAFSVHCIGNLSSLLGFLSWQKKKFTEMVIGFQVRAVTSFPTYIFFFWIAHGQIYLEVNEVNTQIFCLK